MSPHAASLIPSYPPSTLHRAGFTSSPLLFVSLYFPVCHVHPLTSLLLPKELCVSSGSSLPHPCWQPGAVQPPAHCEFPSALSFICQLSSWHHYVEHNCYVSVPAIQTNNRRTSSSHIYLSTIWAVHLPFAVSISHWVFKSG